MYLDTTDKAPNTDVLSKDDVVSPDEVPTSYPSPVKTQKGCNCDYRNWCHYNAGFPTPKKRSASISKLRKETLARCKVCNKPYKYTEMANTGNVWIGCSQSKCNIWVHTKCEGFVALLKSQNKTLRH